MYERYFDSYLNNHRTRGNNTFCTLSGFQGRTARILLSYNQCFFFISRLGQREMVGFRVPRPNAGDFCHHMSSKSIMPGFVT